MVFGIGLLGRLLRCRVYVKQNHWVADMLDACTLGGKAAAVAVSKA